MIKYILLLIIGFILLIKGADFFVDGASSTALNFKVSKIFIGLTIVAFGTSAPELGVSITSLAKGSTDMLLGNVIGSNIFNILLILGVAAVICPIKIKKNTIIKELPLTMLLSTILVTLFLDMQLAQASSNQITRSDAIIMLLFFSIFIYYLINLSKKQKINCNEETPKYRLSISIIITILGLIGIILGSNMVINNASGLAKMLGVSDRVIAISVIALGTSLPELTTTIVSSKKHEQDLFLGNIIGSNIFNICLVLALPVIIFGTITPSSFNYVDLVMLVASSFILYIFATTSKKITRYEGIVLLILFAIYYICVFII